MPIFNYRAKNTQGQELAGTVEAAEPKQALAVLREKGYFTYHLAEKRLGLLVALQRLLKKVGLVQVAGFTRQLSTMITAGLPLTDALTILEGQSAGQLKEIVHEILREVRGGSTLSQALKKYPRVFSPVYAALVEAGESAGVLDTIMARLADNLEFQKEFKGKIKGAMIYPVIIVVGMIAVIMVMMVFVIPKLTLLYSEFNAELPAPTQFLMSLSGFFVDFWWLVIILLGGAVYLYKAVNKIRAGRRKIEEFKYRLPVFGNLIKEIILAETTRTLGLLVGAGVSLLEALEISSKVTDSVLFEEAISQAMDQVEKGYPLASAMENVDLFPSILPQMLAVGEETGKLDEVLLKVSKFFQSESEELIKGLTTAIEPLIMILLGLGVGFLIIGIIMPIYDLTSQF